MSPQRVLILGAGGREHALAWRLAADSPAPEVFVAPGNRGLAESFPCLPADPCDPEAVVRLVREHAIDLVVIGPEAPLVAGVADTLVEAGIPVFGPSRAAAQLEGSKWFAKTVLAEAGVATARALRCETAAAARAALEEFAAPWVLKADGLAAGKGVRVTRDPDEAHAFLDGCFTGAAFGAGGRVVVIEEFLSGEEASVLAVTDGEAFVLLPAARDFKRAFEGDRGPNTGGMGAWAPHPAVSHALEQSIGERVIAPVLRRMRERGTPYRGTLYAGLMLTPKGPQVIEFNARFGDPETQAVLPLLGGSFTGMLASVANGRLDPGAIFRTPGAAVAVALTANGYPESGPAGGRIEGLAACAAREGISVCHAATEPEGAGSRITGGRAAYVVATGESRDLAGSRAREAIAALGGEGWRHRADIPLWSTGLEGPSKVSSAGDGPSRGAELGVTLNNGG